MASDQLRGMNFLSSRKGTQFLDGGGYSPLQSSIHFSPGFRGGVTVAAGDVNGDGAGLLGSDLSASIARQSSSGLLLPYAEADGSVRPNPTGDGGGGAMFLFGDGSVRF